MACSTQSGRIGASVCLCTYEAGCCAALCLRQHHLNCLHSLTRLSLAVVPPCLTCLCAAAGTSSAVSSTCTDQQMPHLAVIAPNLAPSFPNASSSGFSNFLANWELTVAPCSGPAAADAVRDVLRCVAPPEAGSAAWDMCRATRSGNTQSRHRSAAASCGDRG